MRHIHPYFHDYRASQTVPVPYRQGDAHETTRPSREARVTELAMRYERFGETRPICDEGEVFVPDVPGMELDGDED